VPFFQDPPALTNQYRDDRGPTEKDSDLNGDRTEAKLERRVAVARGSETRLPGHSRKRPAGRHIVGQETGQTDPI